MKTRVLKVIVVSLITVSLAVSFFAIPVSAADGYYSAQFPFPIAASDYFGFVLNETSLDNNLFTSFRRPNYVSDQSNYVNYEFKLPSSYVNEDVGRAFCSIILGISKFELIGYTKNHTCWVEPFSFKYQFDLPSSIRRYRLTLRQFVIGTGGGTIVGKSDWISFNGGTNGTINVDQMIIPIVNDYIVPDGTDGGLALCIEYYMESPSYNAVSDGGIYLRYNVLDNVITCNYATASNPNIPSYSKPAGEDKTNELESLDQEVLDSTNEYLDEIEPLFNSSLSSSINFLGNGIHFAGNLMTKFISVHPVISSVVQISLSLGIAATLLGLSGSIIGAATRRRKGGGD